MVTMLKSPALLGSRERAREFLAELPNDLTSIKLIINCQDTEASAPSFVDEVVKIVLVERKAEFLTFEEVPERTASYALRSADRRGVSSRLEVRER